MADLLLWIVIPIGLMGVIGARVVQRGFELRLLVEDGVEAAGRVVTRVKFGARRRYLRYEYHDAAGRRHTHRSLVTRDVWKAHAEGGPISIVYSASRPRVSARAYLVAQARQALARRAPQR